MSFNKSIKWFLWLCLFILLPTILSPSIFVREGMNFLIPVLVLLCYQEELTWPLLGSIACGFLTGLLSSNSYFGIHSLTYALAALVVYYAKTFFFEDRLASVLILAFIFSLLSSLFYAILFYFVGSSFTLSIKWVLTDVIILPILDSWYAFIVFWVGKRMRIMT